MSTYSSVKRLTFTANANQGVMQVFRTTANKTYHIMMVATVNKGADQSMMSIMTTATTDGSNVVTLSDTSTVTKVGTAGISGWSMSVSVAGDPAGIYPVISGAVDSNAMIQAYVYEYTN